MVFHAHFSFVHLQDGVPSLSTKEVPVRVRMNHLKPLFGVPVTVKFLKSGDVTDPPRLVRLDHPNGKSLNGMIRDKLSESPEDAGPGQMQGIPSVRGFFLPRFDFVEASFICI